MGKIQGTGPGAHEWVPQRRPQRVDQAGMGLPQEAWPPPAETSQTTEIINVVTMGTDRPLSHAVLLQWEPIDHYHMQCC